VINLLHDQALHVYLPETEIFQMPQSEAPQFVPARTVTEYQACNINRELRMLTTQLAVS
jgi:hypothetical protein